MPIYKRFIMNLHYSKFMAMDGLVGKIFIPLAVDSGFCRDHRDKNHYQQPKGYIYLPRVSSGEQPEKPTAFKCADLRFWTL